MSCKQNVLLDKMNRTARIKYQNFYNYCIQYKLSKGSLPKKPRFITLTEVKNILMTVNHSDNLN